MNWLNIAGKVAVVTGAGGGIGSAVAVELARLGCRVAALDLDVEQAERTGDAVREAGGESLSLRVDVTSQHEVLAARDQVVDRWGAVDVLVNNAGISVGAPLATIDVAAWQRTLDINLTGYLLCAQAFGAPMLDQGSGSLIHIASICGSMPIVGYGAYPPSKAAVVMLSRSLAMEWGPAGVRSNSVSPGTVVTPLTEALYARDGARERRESATPLRRLGRSQDIADVCAWLASERASYVTGQDITVDGGIKYTSMQQPRD